MTTNNISKIYQRLFNDASLSPELHETLDSGLQKHLKVWTGFIPEIGTQIRVTQQDIDAGIRLDCTHCPVVIATQRAFGDISETVVFDNGHLILIDTDLIDTEAKAFFKIAVSNSVLKWVRDFDRIGVARPIDLTIQKPDNHLILDTAI